jgi:hypothetical protein
VLGTAAGTAQEGEEVAMLEARVVGIEQAQGGTQPQPRLLASRGVLQHESLLQLALDEAVQIESGICLFVCVIGGTICRRVFFVKVEIDVLRTRSPVLGSLHRMICKHFLLFFDLFCVFQILFLCVLYNFEESFLHLNLPPGSQATPTPFLKLLTACNVPLPSLCVMYCIIAYSSII